MKVRIPKAVAIVELERAPFRNAREAREWAKSHGIVGVMSDVDTGGKGMISISGGSLGKMLSGSAVQKSVTPQIHFSALTRLRDVIRESFVGEVHPDYRKGRDGKRSATNGINRMVEIVVLYGCVSCGGIPFRAKTTLKSLKDPAQPTKAYSYEISKIEILKGNCRNASRPSDKTSISPVILLNGIVDVNGYPILPYGNASEEGNGGGL